MKPFCVLFVTNLIVTLDSIAPVYIQNIQNIYYRQLPTKCDKHGRCTIDIRDDDDLKLPDSILGTGGYGYRSGNSKPKPGVDRGDDDNLKSPLSRPDISGDGGSKPKPSVSRDDDDLKAPVSRPNITGDSGSKPKPAADTDDDDLEAPVSRPSISGDSDFKPNPAMDTDDDDLKAPINRPDISGDGDSKQKPAADTDEESASAVEENCHCIPHYQCNNGHTVKDGAGIIDPRSKRDLEYKLPLKDKFKPTNCGPYHVCCSPSEAEPVKPYKHRCGGRNPKGINGKILAASNQGEANFGEWPWQAIVLIFKEEAILFRCGGVLIDKYHVLTAANCVFYLNQRKSRLIVRFGEWDTRTSTEFLAHKDYKVSEIIIHPEFRNTSLWNDIAVLSLQDPVLFQPHIDTVCLPEYGEVFSGQNCIVTGWGKKTYKGGSYSSVMKEVAVQVIDNNKCENMLRKTRLGKFFQLHESFLCAGGEDGLDSCKGDGGGPLVCYRYLKGKSYALAGIVSWGIDCGQPGVPGVYVNIQKYLDWISNTTGVTLEDYWPEQ